MPLNLFNDSDQTYMLQQKQWKSELDPLLSNPLTQGSLLKSINLTANTALVINHYLGRQMQGWFIVDNTSFCEIKRTAPLNNQTLTLEANANTTISLWVF